MRYGETGFNDYLLRYSNPEDKEYKHRNYAETVEHYKAMAVHIKGKTPFTLLRQKRPNESDEARAYRVDSYKPATKSAAQKAIQVINRIFNPRLYKIEFGDDPGTIPEGEGIRVYFEEDYPYYLSLMNFIRGVFVRENLTDPNAVILIEPVEYPDDTMTLSRPTPKFFNADDVLDFWPEEYYLLRSNDRLIYVDRDFVRYFKKDGKVFDLEIEVKHYCGEPPCFRLGGLVYDIDAPQMYQSFVSGVLPHWDEAVCLRSDLAVSIVNNVYPEKWEFTAECEAQGCNAGRIKTKDHVGDTCEIECKRCNGTGRIAVRGPFDVYQINRDALNPDAPLPVPPMGYVQKDLETVRVMSEMAEQEIMKGFASLNMEVLDRVGEDQSGIAKTIDRQDLDQFLQGYANHVFKYVIPNIVYYSIAWRYGAMGVDINESMPQISEPVSFNVLSIDQLVAELANMKQNGVSTALQIGIQEDIIDKRFIDEADKEKYRAILQLDPMPGKSPDEITAAYGSGIISRETWYIHEMISDLVNEAIANSDTFLL